MMIEGLKENVPLGLSSPTRSRINSAAHSTTSVNNTLFPTAHSSSMPPQTPRPDPKKTAGGIVLNPQPGESPNDPLNWPSWRRDVALVSLGFFCMVGGGMTPVLAAGFKEVSATFDVPVPRVALTTGLYMMGLGLGSVVASPTAILFGKRPVYLFGAILFLLSAIWCALAKNFASLIVARIFMGLAVSPVECLPSASVAEIFFLHERAYRLGIYTLLLLGGKNLIPLVSAAIINSLGWRWVFYIVAIVVAFGGTLLFFFVPETFWDRTPTRTKKSSKSRRTSLSQMVHSSKNKEFGHDETIHENKEFGASERQVRFGADVPDKSEKTHDEHINNVESKEAKPLAIDTEKAAIDRISVAHLTAHRGDSEPPSALPMSPGAVEAGTPAPLSYTHHYTRAPAKTFGQTLRPYSGRLSHDNWFKVALRPFILFAYPSILWSTVVYALSVGWLIVLSESIATIYETKSSYNFTPLQAGLVYLSPFIGGVLGTAVAGKVSDIIVRYMSRKNGGIYEPEFRLVMAIPVALCTSIGLMGYGWSAQEKDNFMVPTIFFGIISFGCCLGSTTAITFAVDSYRSLAGEALVTLNFSKSLSNSIA